MNRFWERRWVIYGTYALAALATAIQALLIYSKDVPVQPGAYRPTTYENFVIFKHSFQHLVEGLNPYMSFPSEQWDLFKYSPAFAVAMAPFQSVPDAIGLPAWGLLNALIPLLALFRLPVLNEKQKIFVAWVLLPEMVITLQNSQSNGLTLGFLLLAWVGLEQGKLLRASGWIMAAAFIKVFGIIAAVLVFLYPQPRKSVLLLMGWGVFFTLIPLVALSPSSLYQVYLWWLELLQSDHAASIGLSVNGWLESWFGLEPPKLAITLLGLALFLASIFGRRLMKPAGRFSADPVFRTTAWASLLLWVVIFNHKAESPTFVIALAGAGLWYVVSAKKRWMTALFWTAFFFSSISPTDLFPRQLREQIVQPWVLKAVPCIVLWAVVTWQLINWKKSAQPETHGGIDP
jgi:hypothetical protein